VHSPIPTRPANMASTSQRDPLAGHQAHLTSLTHTRLGVREPEPVGGLRADAPAALVCGRALAKRLTAMRWVPAATTTALCLEIDEVAARPRPSADGQHQHADMSAAARNEIQPLLNDREVGR
jgi:hypothetical protein